MRRLLVFILSALFLKARLKYAIFLPCLILHKSGRLPDQLSSTFFKKFGALFLLASTLYPHCILFFLFFGVKTPEGAPAFS